MYLIDKSKLFSKILKKRVHVKLILENLKKFQLNANQKYYLPTRPVLVFYHAVFAQKFLMYELNAFYYYELYLYLMNLLELIDQ